MAITLTTNVLRSDQRLRVVLRGAVQGVGFRPFVYRLAGSLRLRGWVSNGSQGVTIEVEGPSATLQNFLVRLEREKPALAFIQGLEFTYLDSVGFRDFEIRSSTEEGGKTAVIRPDIATCPECLHELFDPADRRYRYPFINCTHCGPRFSILQALPYDRVHTTMKTFPLCRLCREEYESPDDRRFHAEPNACPACGPHLTCRDAHGNILAEKEEALKRVVDAIRQGQIVALKGIGGFQLWVDARDPRAVHRLRERKHREEKPFALMCPSLDDTQRLCDVSALEERLLLSAEAPIVLLQRRSSGPSESWEGDLAIAPHNPSLGIMLPYSPLHHLLMRELGFPVVATSGNVSDEPICISDSEALSRLSGIADLFLTHNRPIARPEDDSVVRVIMDRELMIRRARGYAPLPITLPKEAPSLLAVGAQLKNTVAVTAGHSAFLSQHIGDLQSMPAVNAFQKVIQDFKALYELRPETIACDLHPNYLSTQYAERMNQPLVRVQHHYAHALSCMADNELEPPVLGVTWDGTGYGLDQTIWGGEFLRIHEGGFERFAHFRTFSLPGGEKAIEEPARLAIALLYEIFGDEAFTQTDLAPLNAYSDRERKLLKAMLKQKINTPKTSSVGRLFDAVAALLGIRQVVHFEGQAAMELEFTLNGVQTEAVYPIEIHSDSNNPLVIDWESMVRAILDDVRAHVPIGQISAKFHHTLAEVIVDVTKRSGEERVVLSGGCFQNRYLTEQTVHRLQNAHLRPYWHQRIPPNDGGIALGQIMAVLQARKELCVSASPAKY